MLLLCHHSWIESEVPAVETDICTDNRAQYFQSTPFNLVKLILLHRQECYGGKLTTRILHRKLHPGLEWRIFYNLTSEDIDDVISCIYTVVCEILLSL